MFNKEVALMLYVDDVAKEKAFWSAIGFTIFEEETVMGFDSFNMKTDPDASLTITVYAKDFIQQVSPEVIDMKPSLLFESSNLDALHQRVAAQTTKLSPIQMEPFPHFNFANPSGHYVAVKRV